VRSYRGVLQQQTEGAVGYFVKASSAVHHRMKP